MVQLSVLNPGEIDLIHNNALRLLSETGITLTHPQGRELLCDNGVHVAGERVQIPSDLVKKTLMTCPSQVSLQGRASSITLGNGGLSWHNTGGARLVYEPRQNACHAPTLVDLNDSTRLLDSLANVDSITPFYTPCDVPPEKTALAMYRACLSLTGKPVQSPGVQTGAEVRRIAQMAAVIGDPATHLWISVSPLSPLSMPDDVVEATLECARLGIPYGTLPAPLGGATAPFSLAGALTQQHAEALAAILLAQLARPGLPVIYYGRLSFMEPRTAQSSWSPATLGMASAAAVQLGHYVGLPVNVYGFCSDANTLDLQDGAERILNAALPALAGADELSGIGSLGAVVAGSLAQMVIDDSLAASLRRLRRGITVDEDTLAFELIGAVMQGSRSFMAEKHTVRHMRAGEVDFSPLAVRLGWEEWMAGGATTLALRAQEKAEKLLEKYQPLPLTLEQETELDELYMCEL